jgi:tetratricopeptide (TPR) repeat protein
MQLLNRTLRLSFVALAAFVFILQSGTTPSAQTTVPARTSHVNDFAGVVDESTRTRLGNVLGELERRTGIQFDIATVQSTSGIDIVEFARQLAQDWDIGARTTRKKSLLLVISIDEKAAVTRFSRTVQSDLPEGAVAEMAQRTRSLVNSDRFNAGLNEAIDFFLTSLGKRLAFTLQDIDPSAGMAAEPATNDQTNRANVSYVSTGQETRKRVVTAPPAPEKQDAPPASIVEQPTPSPTTEIAKEPERAAATRTTSRVPATRRNARPQRANTPEEDADESEEVELTLTLPLAERITALKQFLADYPNSRSKPRAQELLVSAHAALGDQQLKNGDTTQGMENFRLAVEEAPLDVTEKLFSGVIAQIPLNLYLRNERIAAFKTAESIEAKFGSDPQRLLALANFYLGIEQGDEAARLATKAIALAPNLAEAHYILGVGRHISLRLDEAAAEYQKAIELDGNFRAARRSLADLSRASGKSEEALAFYREQLSVDAKDKVARAGVVISLFDLGRTDEAEKELAAALEEDPKNVSLLVGAAYWFAAHNDSKRALEFAAKAVEIEPRYTWSQIAFARALVGEKRPLDAERALRYARLFGKFPTLDYELASVLASAALYDEAAEVLVKSFTLKDGEIETRLGGRTTASASNFIDLLAPERRGSLFQFTAADTPENARILKSLLTFTAATQPADGGQLNEEALVAAGKEFAAGDDPMRIYRQLYVASRLMRFTKSYDAVLELLTAARGSVDAGLDVPAVTVAVQADELREIRARSIAAGNTPTIADAPRNLLGNILRGRIEDLAGWVLFNQEQASEAVEPLRRAVNILPEGTPSWRTASWHLGAALEQTGSNEEALNHYIKSYVAGEPDSVRRSLIERLYVKVHGSTEGLDARLGPATTSSSSTTLPTPSPEGTNVAETVTPAATDNSSSATQSEPKAADTSAEPPASPVTPPEESNKSVEETQPSEAPASTPSPRVRRSSDPDLSEAPSKPPKPRATLKITGQVKDASGVALVNVVVVLISPGGTVIASTTDSEGNYSFTVSPSDKAFRILPSKEGFSFQPLDKSIVISSDDQKDIDFIGVPITQP